MENMSPENAEIAQTAPALQSSPEQGSKPKNGSKIVSITCAILAVAGIAFGVFEYIDSGNKSLKISELSAKLDLVKMETKPELVEKVEDGVERTYVEPVETVVAKDYIYLGEWGVKIKKPENVRYIQYSLNNYKNSFYAYMTSQASVDAFGEDALKGFVGSESFLIIERYAEGTKEKSSYAGDGMAKPEYWFTLDGYDYFGLISGAADSVASWANHFKASSNYSAI